MFFKVLKNIPFLFVLFVKFVSEGFYIHLPFPFRSLSLSLSFSFSFSVFLRLGLYWP